VYVQISGSRRIYRISNILGKKIAKTAKKKAKRGNFNGLVVYFNV
jgi:hypothetical protein